MARFPALPIWVDSLIADTEYLTDQEFGAYCRMLFVSWLSPKCDLPRDEVWLKKRFKGAAENWQVYEMIIKTYFTMRGSRLTQRRLKRERKFVETKRQNQSARAKLRWDKEKHPCHGNADVGIAPTPTPIPIPLKTKKLREGGANAPAPNGASPPQPSQPTGQKTTHHPLPQPRDWTPKIWAELKARELLGDIDARYHRVLDEFREYEGGRGRVMKDWSFVFLGFVRKDAKWAADRADEQERFAQARARMALDKTGNNR